MTTDELFKRNRFFTLKTNNKIEEFDSLETCFEQHDIKLIILDKFKCISNNGSSYDKRISEFTFYSSEKKEIKITLNKWSINQIHTISRLNKEVYFKIEFKDPLGRLRFLNYHIEAIEAKELKDNINNHDLKIVQEALKSLDKLSIYESWEHYDLMLENEKLKQEIEDLKKQLSRNNSI
jgi:hypothetical protein